MQLTEQQRAELERRGWQITSLYCGLGDMEVWWHPQTDTTVKLHQDGRIRWNGDPGACAEFAHVLKYAPPGYRLVPEEVLRNAVQVCDMHINLARIACNVDVTPLVRHTRAALASALQGKEGER
ncbi:hypothetical protein [Symbiobacterium terraclitae]|uniref:hypothetical protein n=1 Tax=Symbiobacterium terraclitae TaxID=557451 RepID=UPI0035B50589